MATKNTNLSLYVGCIPCKGQASVVNSYFSEWGLINSVNLKLRKNGKCCGFGYIMCADEPTYNAILAAKPHNLYNRELIVERVLTKEERALKSLQLDSRRLIVYNLEQTWTSAKLLEFFSQIRDHTEVMP